MTDCRLIRKGLSRKMGDAAPDEREQKHLMHCPECRKYYDDLDLLAAALNKVSVEPLKADEFAVMKEGLDARIVGYLDRATGLYRFVVRYGISAASLFLLVFVSLMSGLKYPDVREADVESSLKQDEYGLEAVAEETLDSGYIDIIVHDVTNKFGYSTGDMLLGELSSEELEYLENSLDVGGIL